MTNDQLITLGVLFAVICLALFVDKIDKRVRVLEQADGISIHKVTWRDPRPWWRRLIERVSKHVRK